MISLATLLNFVAIPPPTVSIWTLNFPNSRRKNRRAKVFKPGLTQTNVCSPSSIVPYSNSLCASDYAKKTNCQFSACVIGQHALLILYTECDYHAYKLLMLCLFVPLGVYARKFSFEIWFHSRTVPRCCLLDLKPYSARILVKVRQVYIQSRPRLRFSPRSCGAARTSSLQLWITVAFQVHKRP